MFLNKIEFRSSWQYAIDLLFDENEINPEDLYLTILSYLYNKHLIVLAIFTIKKEVLETKHSQSIILSHNNSFFIKKMDFIKFQNWLHYRFDYDSRYLEQGDLYGFKLIFEKESFLYFLQINNLNMEDFCKRVRPIVPWKKEMLDLVK